MILKFEDYLNESNKVPKTSVIIKFPVGNGIIHDLKEFFKSKNLSVTVLDGSENEYPYNEVDLDSDVIMQLQKD